MDEMKFAPVSILNEVFSDIYRPIKNIVGAGKSKVLEGLEVGFSSYFKDKYERYSRIKTLLSPIDSVAVEDIYVMPTINSEKGLRVNNIFETIEDCRISIINGMAGAGKSLLLRHLFVKYSRINRGIIPIIIELRNVNFENELFTDLAFRDFKSSSPLFDEKAFLRIVARAKVIFFLDGFDEISPQHRKRALKQISEFKDEFPAARIVLTSRPTEGLKGWHEAVFFHIQPLDKDQIVEVINRSPVIKEIRDKFIQNVNNEYIKTHLEFLENPLLNNMMLLTFIRGGDIPKQLHSFYKKSFETLYKTHDEMKFLYKREFHSNVAEDIFLQIWRAFCYFSYLDNEYSFNYEDISSYLQRAIEFVGINEECDKVIEDLTESVCVIVKDGDKYVFLHRSFQEFSVAEFICIEDITNAYEILSYINDNRDTTIIDMAFAINKAKIEKEYFLRRIEECIANYKSSESARRKVLMFYKDMWLSLRSETEDDTRSGVSLAFSDASKSDYVYTHFAFTLINLYNETFGSNKWIDMQSWLVNKLGPSVQKGSFGVEKMTEEELKENGLAEYVDMYVEVMIRLRNRIIDEIKKRERILDLHPKVNR